MGSQTLDLFAGPGGWDMGLRAAGAPPGIGVEHDSAACATGRAAGHVRLLADVAELDPLSFRSSTVAQVASPPCQGFSAAGKGRGRDDLGVLLRGIGELAAGRDPRASVRENCTDHRSALVLDPLRYAIALRPRWLAWEQVPAVLPIWQACADVLRGRGYSVWAGILHAEQYGVPQTRRRAILMASRDVAVTPPAPTHSRYYPRSPEKLDQGVKKWVSMAEALGYAGMTGHLRSNYGTGGDPAARGKRDLNRPAFTITSKTDRSRWVLSMGSRAHSTRRQPDAPAPTLHFSKRLSAAEWIFDRPATTVQGDPRLAAPGHRCMTSDCHPDRSQESMMAQAIQVSLAEAAVLQSFPADYPFQGSRSQQYRQVGDAVPPLLATHIISALTFMPNAVG